MTRAPVKLLMLSISSSYSSVRLDSWFSLLYRWGNRLSLAKPRVSQGARGRGVESVWVEPAVPGSREGGAPDSGFLAGPMSLGPRGTLTQLGSSFHEKLF